jgi:TrmH family RNA methyltransferase
MLSTAKIKLINSLQIKKYRDEHSLFVAEGTKLVRDIFPYFSCQWLIATDEWLKENPSLQADENIAATPEELKKISGLKTPPSVVAVFRKPDEPIHLEEISHSLSIVLDEVQDPGNLGTILRIADWFGIENIICSETSADIFNPKTVQATMGAIARVRVHYTSLPDFFAQLPASLPIFGTYMNGENIYQESLPKKGIIVMGNEGRGISPNLERFINRRIAIPSFPAERNTSESLNVAIATAIVCSEFRRR